MRTNTKKWSIYLLRNERNALYTGVTTNLPKRLHAHKNKLARGAKFTKACKSLELVYHCEVGPRTLALKIEARIKRLKKSQKNVLVSSNLSLNQLLEFTAIGNPLTEQQPPASALH
jgi:putative endonuclease